MNFFRSISRQLSDIWGQSSWLGRAGFAGTAVICVATVIGVGLWSSRPDFVALATNLAPSEAAEIISKLDAAGIPNQMNFSGSTVMVAKNQWNRARVLMGDAVGSTPSGMDSLGESLLGDPTMNHYRILRSREDSLARTIMRMNSVVKATVHIGQSEPSPFVREQAPTTASVVLELKPAAVFTREQAAAIVAMVANSIEGMQPSGVTVLDTKGRLLSSNSSSPNAEVANQFEYRGQVEADLASKVTMMLAEMLGPGHAVVRVTADVDFTQSERVETVYDPTQKVKKSERIKTVSRSNASTGAQGPAGTASNIRPAPATSPSSPVRETEEENETEFETGKNVITFKEPAGTVKRLTVAAIVDLPAANRDPQAGGQPGGNPTGSAVAGITPQQVEGIIKQAVGFDPARGDQIEVLISGLVGTSAPPDDGLLEQQKWDNYGSLARNSSLGLAAIVALVLGIIILRKMKPISIAGKAEAELPLERARSLAELVSEARRDPAGVAGVFSNWLEDKPGQVRKEQLERAA